HSVAANEIVTWESATKKNIGLDITMLDRRLSLTGEYYVNQTNDLLLSPTLPAVFGYGRSFPPQNMGKIENKGWDIQVGWKDDKENFRYGFQANLSDVKNKVLKMGEEAANLGTQVRLEGYPLNAFYGLVDKGLSQEADYIYNSTSKSYTLKPDIPYFTGDPM